MQGFVTLTGVREGEWQKIKEEHNQSWDWVDPKPPNVEQCRLWAVAMQLAQEEELRSLLIRST